MANDVKHRARARVREARRQAAGQVAGKPHEKPMSEQATHQGGGGVNKDHKPHGGGPIPKGRG